MTKEKILDILWKVFNHEILPDVAINELELASTSKPNVSIDELLIEFKDRRDAYEKSKKYIDGDVFFVGKKMECDYIIKRLTSLKPNVSEELSNDEKLANEFISWRDSLNKEMRGGVLMFDAPKHHKWLSEDELLTYYMDFVRYDR